MRDVSVSILTKNIFLVIEIMKSIFQSYALVYYLAVLLVFLHQKNIDHESYDHSKNHELQTILND